MKRIRTGVRNAALVFALGALLSLCCLGDRSLLAQSGMKMTPPPDFQRVAPSKYGFDGTLERLKAAVEEHNLMVVAELNPQQMLRLVGVQVGGMRQVMFFHPRFMKELLERNPHATIEPPLKIAVMKRPDGTVLVRYVRPSTVFEKYEGLEEFGKRM